MTISPPLLGNVGALPLLCSSSPVIPLGLSFVMCKIFCSFLSPLSSAAPATPLLPWRENELNVNKWLIPRDETLALRGNPGLIKPRLSRGTSFFCLLWRWGGVTRTKGKSRVGGRWLLWVAGIPTGDYGPRGVSLAPFFVALSPFIHTIHPQHETKPANDQ